MSDLTSCPNPKCELSATCRVVAPSVPGDVERRMLYDGESGCWQEPPCHRGITPSDWPGPGKQVRTDGMDLEFVHA